LFSCINGHDQFNGDSGHDLVISEDDIVIHTEIQICVSFIGNKKISLNRACEGSQCFPLVKEDVQDISNSTEKEDWDDKGKDGEINWRCSRFLRLIYDDDDEEEEKEEQKKIQWYDILLNYCKRKALNILTGLYVL
jgi:hypothetical protein